jgi:hypothetical protein
MPPWKLSTEAMLTILPWRPPPGEGLAEQEDRLQIDVHDVVPVGLADIDGIGAPDDTGIVDQPVERAAFVPDPVQHRAGGCRVGKVGAYRLELPTG